MAEAIGKGLASYLSIIKADSTEPANKKPIEPISHRELGPKRGVQISISQEALDRRKTD